MKIAFPKMASKWFGILLLSLFFYVFTITPLFAQQAILSSGAEAEGNGSMSYSFGQVFYRAYTGTGGSIGEGVQQVYEISVVKITSLEEKIELSASVYPNPARDYLMLYMDEQDFSQVRYHLFDVHGKTLGQKDILQPETQINMQDLAPAVYLLHVVKDHQALKVFKIVKK
jgi:hypothetical protein